MEELEMTLEPSGTSPDNTTSDDKTTQPTPTGDDGGDKSKSEKSPEEKIASLTEQVSNLNIALRQSREEKRNLAVPPKEELKDDLSKKIEETATRVVNENLFKGNEQSAIKEVLKKFPTLSDHDEWSKVVSNYNGKRGKTSVENIVNDLIDAYVVANRDKISDESFQKGLKEGIARSLTNDIASAGGGTPQGQQPSVSLTPEEKQAAKKGRIAESDYQKMKGAAEWDEEFELPS